MDGAMLVYVNDGQVARLGSINDLRSSRDQETWRLELQNDRCGENGLFRKRSSKITSNIAMAVVWWIQIVCILLCIIAVTGKVMVQVL